MSATSTAVESVDVADQLIAEAGGLWTQYEYHPWIEGLADGSPELGQFLYFHRFDTSYSADMHRALALGIAKAPAGCDWARASVALLYETFIFGR